MHTSEHHPMILVVAFKAAAAGVAATLAACSATNMYQTHTLLRQSQASSCPPAAASVSVVSSASASVATAFPTAIQNNEGDHHLRSAQQIVDQVTTGRGSPSGRRELLQLFLSSKVPSKDDVQGEWNGILLDNNSWAMVSDGCGWSMLLAGCK